MRQINTNKLFVIYFLLQLFQAGDNLKASDDKNIRMQSPINVVFENIISFKNEKAKETKTHLHSKCNRVVQVWRFTRLG